MRRYLYELHRKPDDHKKRVALMFSGAITLLIFGIWSLAVFGTSGEKLANKDIKSDKVQEVSPFQSIRMNLASSFESVRASFGGLKGSLETVDLEAEYEDMRDNALSNYE